MTLGKYTHARISISSGNFAGSTRFTFFGVNHYKCLGDIKDIRWTLKDIPTFYIFDGKKVDYTEDERSPWTRMETQMILVLKMKKSII